MIDQNITWWTRRENEAWDVFEDKASQVAIENQDYLEAWTKLTAKRLTRHVINLFNRGEIS